MADQQLNPEEPTQTPEEIEALKSSYQSLTFFAKPMFPALSVFKSSTRIIGWNKLHNMGLFQGVFAQANFNKIVHHQNPAAVIAIMRGQGE